jgi:thioredoxin 1
MRDILWIAAAAVLLMLIWRGVSSRSGGPLPAEPPADEWFQKTVVGPSAERPVLVKFGAAWCGPCRAMEPELDKLESSLGDKLRVVRIDVDEREKVADHYGIRGIPRTLVFSEGKVVADAAGMHDADELKSLVKKWLR